jgi:arginase family enzyme
MLNYPKMNSVAPSLFDAPHGLPADVQPGVLGVVGMPSDWTHTSRVGARFGPHALRLATTEMTKAISGEQTEFIDPASKEILLRNCDQWIVDCGDSEIFPNCVEETTEAIASMTRAITAGGGIPLSLGGDHYNGFPACLGYSRGLTDRDPDRKFGYIQVDGHLDFTDRLGAWGTHNHATNGRRISEFSNILQANMVWIGISGWVDGSELELIESRGGKVFSSGDVHHLGISKVTELAIEHATRGCESLYVSLCIDAMDAGYLPGTGSIVHSGITPRQYCQMLDVMAQAPIDGLDIVEVCPPLDPSGRTQRIAGHLLTRILRNYMFSVEGDAAS